MWCSDGSVARTFGEVGGSNPSTGAKNNNTMKWTSDELEFLIQHYADNYTEDLAIALNRPLRGCYGMANKLGLRKSKDFITMCGRLCSTNPVFQATRFKKGHIAHNKGKKMPPELRDKMSHTFFKDGHLPHNTREDGALTKRADGYWWIRIALGKWRQLHTYTWEQANRPIDPKIEMVKFIDGNPDNCSLDNLYLSNRVENMKMNTIHRYPSEVKQTIKILRKLKKVIDNEK